MLIFDNRDEFGTFSVILRDKITFDDPDLYIKVIKADNLSFIYFQLINESTSTAYRTFTIPLIELDQGQYRAEIFQGISPNPEDCLIDEPTTIILGRFYDCDPATLTATLRLEANASFGDVVLGECAILDPTIISADITFNCGETTIDSELTLNAIATFDGIEIQKSIYSTYMRIDGEIYNTIYTTEEEYTTYNE